MLSTWIVGGTGGIYQFPLQLSLLTSEIFKDNFELFNNVMTLLLLLLFCLIFKYLLPTSFPCNSGFGGTFYSIIIMKSLLSWGKVPRRSNLLL